MSERRAIPFRGGGFNPMPRRALPWIVFVMLIALWQAASSAGLLPPLFMPSPAAVVRGLVDVWANGKLVENINASLEVLITGSIIATTVGLAAALATGLFSAARAAAAPVHA